MDEKRSKRNKNVDGAPETVGKESAEWAEVQTKRGVYRPENCGVAPIQGYVLTRATLPNGYKGRPWVAYVIELTAPALAVDQGEETPTDHPAGAHVLLPESSRLRVLRDYLDARMLIEVRVAVLGKEATGNGDDERWTYKINANRKTSKARPLIVPMHSSSVDAPEKSARNQDDLPF